MVNLPPLTEDDIERFSEAKRHYFRTGDREGLRTAFEIWTKSTDYYLKANQLKQLMNGVASEELDQETMDYIMNYSDQSPDGKIDFIEFFRIIKQSLVQAALRLNKFI